MRAALRAFRKYDWFLIVAVVLLSLGGLVVIYSIAQHQSKIELLFYKQLAFIGIGFVTMLTLGRVDYRIFKNWGWAALIAYIGILVVLVAVLFFGIEVRGAKGWFVAGRFGFQPVEFTKIILILVLAKYLSLSHIEIHRLQHIVVSGLYVAIPTALVLAQPDLGSVLIVVALWVAMMVIAGIKLKQLLILGLLAVVGIALSWLYLLQDYQKTRVLAFLNPSLDPLGAGYNRNQALIAIGSGGVWGRGLSEATQAQFGFLPEAHTDFILAAIAETWGLVGLLGVFGLWLVIFWRLMSIAERSSNNFARLFIAGFFVVVMIQLFINAAVNFGLLPITGIPSPFLSYGGSGYLALSLGIGLILSIERINKS